MRPKREVSSWNGNNHDPAKRKTRMNLPVRMFCLVWICSVFLIDWLLHKMPGLDKPPQFLSDLAEAVHSLVTGNYLYQ